MSGTRGRLWAGLASAFCVSLALSAVALATSAHRQKTRTDASHMHRCVASHHTAAHPRRRTHCRRKGTAQHTDHVSTPAQPPTMSMPGDSANMPSSTDGAPVEPTPAPTPTPTPAPSAPSEAPEGSGGTPPAVPHVQVIGVEYRFTLSRTTVPAGEVIFDFVNHGQDEHNLNVSIAEGALVGAIPDTPAGGTVERSSSCSPAPTRCSARCPDTR